MKILPYEFLLMLALILCIHVLSRLGQGASYPSDGIIGGEGEGSVCRLAIPELRQRKFEQRKIPWLPCDLCEKSIGQTWFKGPSHDLSGPLDRGSKLITRQWADIEQRSIEPGPEFGVAEQIAIEVGTHRKHHMYSLIAVCCRNERIDELSLNEFIFGLSVQLLELIYDEKQGCVPTAVENLAESAGSSLRVLAEQLGDGFYLTQTFPESPGIM